MMATQIFKESNIPSIFRKAIFMALMVAAGEFICHGQAQINRMEYWLDNNFAGRTSDAVSPAGIDNYETLMDLSSVTTGAHILSVRFHDNAGRWSVTSRHPFVKITPYESAPSFTAVERWIDDRPSSVQEDITGPGLLVLDDALDFSSLAEGVHKLNFRARERTGRWSVLYSILFIKKSVRQTGPGIVSYQYWVDDTGTEFNSVSTGLPSTVLNLDNSIDLTGIAEGTHNYYIRFLDESGTWSIPLIKSFDRVSIVTGAEEIYGKFKANIWPSPLKGDFLNMELEGTDGRDIELKIMDLTGKTRLLKTVKYIDQGIRINLSALDNGTYILMYRTHDRTGSAKFIILR